MTYLPWKAVAATEGSALVMASEFRLTSIRHAPSFLMDALRIRRQALAAPGALGVALEARPLERTFRTLSAWRDRAALNAFVSTEPHRSSMVRHRRAMESSRFLFWTTDELPVTWSEAVRRLRDSDSPS